MSNRNQFLGDARVRHRMHAKRSTPRYAPRDTGLAEKKQHPWRCGRDSGRRCPRPQGRAHISRQPPQQARKASAPRRQPKRRSARSGHTAPGRGHHGSTRSPYSRRGDQRGPGSPADCLLPEATVRATLRARQMHDWLRAGGVLRALPSAQRQAAELGLDVAGAFVARDTLAGLALERNKCYTATSGFSTATKVASPHSQPRSSLDGECPAGSNEIPSGGEPTAGSRQPVSRLPCRRRRTAALAHPGAPPSQHGPRQGRRVANGDVANAAVRGDSPRATVDGNASY